jgi:hypothetical protein
MKRIFLLLVLSVLAFSIAFAIDKKKTTDPVGFSARVMDTTKLGAYQTADSVQIVVVFHGATNSGQTLNAWYNAGDAEADTSNGILAWWDQIADIDADSGAGFYTVSGRFFDYSLGTDVYRYLEFYLGGSADSAAVQAMLDAQTTGLIDAGDLDSIIRAVIADTGSYTVNAYVVGVDSGAINLAQMSGELPNANIATIDVNVASASSNSIEDADIATITVTLVATDSVVSMLTSYGWKLGIVDGSHSTYETNADGDTNFIISPSGTDTLRLVRIHTGGTAGGRPDSTRSEGD